MKRLLALTLALAAAPRPAPADEGMWTFDAFPSAAVAKKYGFSPDQAWLDEARLASARLAGGCSASFVSPDGLVMTNHHCVHKCVEQLSTAARDLVKDGFVAATGADELRCPGVELNQLLALTDVTARVKKATAGLDGPRYAAAFQGVKAAIEGECQTEAALRCEVVTLYQGGVFTLHRYRRFADVRLTFAPEFAIAFFGGDPDNFQFPRYDLDLAFLRVYEDGKPAATPHHFRWSKAGAAPGDLTFVAGHPGTTQRLFTVAQLEQLRAFDLPDTLQRLAEERGLLTGFQLVGPEEKRVSTARLFGMENSLKVRRGQLDALRDPGLLARKVREEEALRAAVRKDPRLAGARAAWDDLARVQRRWEELRVPYLWLEAYATGRGRVGGELLWIARNLVRGVAEKAKPDAERLEEYAEAALPNLAVELFSKAPIDPTFEKVRLAHWLAKVREHLGPDHAAVKRLLGARSPEEVAAGLVDGTALRDPEARRTLWEGGPAAIAASADPLVAFARAAEPDARPLRVAHEQEVERAEERAHALLADARFAVHGRSVYPDATFTLRLSYGQVKGWREGDREVAPFTTFAGAFERHTGREPFALPPSWLAAKEKLDLAVPFNLVTDNDIIGGNSGSPMFDRERAIVGLIFDGNIHSLGGDFTFDARLNRAVAVDARAILQSLDVIYGASRIAAELRAAPGAAPGAGGAPTVPAAAPAR